MLFDKYQYNEEDIKERGYSRHCLVKNEAGECFWAKWILGVEKNDSKLKMLKDRLRALQGAKHTCLPDIIEYNFDEKQEAYAIVYKHLEDIESLESKVNSLGIQNIMGGLIDLAGCLNSLHSKNGITHGDINPGNIFVDKNGQFFLIDFHLAEITRTLSQEKDLVIFTRNFAAPEKFERLKTSGFSYQSDIYSFGKIIDWIFHECNEGIPEEQTRELQRLVATKPEERPRWLEVIDFLKKFPVLSNTENIYIGYHRNVHNHIDFSNLTGTPVFDIAPKKPDNNYLTYFINIVINNVVLNCSWIEEEHKIMINKIDNDDKYIDRKIRDGEKLPFKIKFTESHCDYDLTPYFKKWFGKKQIQNSLRQQGRHIKNELEFYRELLEKELEVIERNSLVLRYDEWRQEGSDLVFYIKEHEKNSELNFILNHIENGNAPNSDGIGYILSGNADRKQSKDDVQFTGKPYEYEMDKDKDNKSVYLFKIRDYELKEKDKDKMPIKGCILENVIQKGEEKRRQLEAIRKAEKNEVQNPRLIFALFTPDKLPPTEFPSYEPLDHVYQKDKDGNDMIYSANQNKAIRNAVSKSPLSIIQGPPGTGKTTVITEIVFQILAKEPQAKILISSQTNNAVDQVLENLLKKGLPILRLNAVTAMNIKEEIQEHTLGKKLDHWKAQVRKIANENFRNIIRDFPDKEKELRQLYGDWLNVISALDENSEINKKLIDSIRVIGATCNHIAAKIYSEWNFRFDYVIMDEAGKATTAEALVPITMGNNLIFVGDHRQLRPMLTTTREVEKWLRDKFKKETDELDEWDDYINRPSLFEQVIEKIDQRYKSQLTECRRLPPDQVALTSKYFYESAGDEPIEPGPRDSSAEHNLPLAITSSLFFIDIGNNNKNKKDKDGSSFNEDSAKIVIEILKCLDKYEIVKNYSFGVIACYKAQYSLLKKLTDKLIGRGELDSVYKWENEENKFIVSVVDRFQGLERDIIILDLVKSGVDLDLGFMEVPNRINVALSRNKRLLVIVGDYNSLVNASTKRLKGEKAALQHYLENINPKWIVPAGKIKELFK
jgi:superfamily I DNA and/or RNA helicase/tRNA A-37 threonylcarbamoyl transferase component Bud32